MEAAQGISASLQEVFAKIEKVAEKHLEMLKEGAEQLHKGAPMGDVKQKLVGHVE